MNENNKNKMPGVAILVLLLLGAGLLWVFGQGVFW